MAKRADDGLPNTEEMLRRAVADVSAFTEWLVAASPFPLRDAAARLRLLARNFYWIRAAYNGHRERGTICVVREQLNLVRAFLSEVPAHVAFAEAWFRHRWHAGETTADLRRQDRLRATVIDDRIQRAKGELQAAKEAFGRVAWTRAVATAFAVNLGRKLVGRSGESGSVVPLGFGDLYFQLSTVGASVQVLFDFWDVSSIQFPDAEGRYHDDPRFESDKESVQLAGAYLMQFNSAKARVPAGDGELMTAAGIAMVNVLMRLSRYRVSKHSTLAKAKIYLLLAAISHSHVENLRRACKVRACLVVPERTLNELEKEERLTLSRERFYIATAVMLAKQSVLLGRRDWSWGLIAPRSEWIPDDADVLRTFDATAVVRLAEKIDQQIRA